MYAMDQQHRSSTPKEKSSANLTGIPTQMKQNLESRSGLSFDIVDGFFPDRLRRP